MLSLYSTWNWACGAKVEKTLFVKEGKSTRQAQSIALWEIQFHIRFRIKRGQSWLNESRVLATLRLIVKKLHHLEDNILSWMHHRFIYRIFNSVAGWFSTQACYVLCFQRGAAKKAAEMIPAIAIGLVALQCQAMVATSEILPNSNPSDSGDMPIRA